eukprot:TRINITY_DN18467_c0_g1_i2.p1 TRINITY_DN18467_c0_g1~~TRINITY_DN18467_c0_g1_i2.p1  ORF type:complete len:178 (+),score=29.09 TRINITY_DN18467_c0_g1_i2:185-718(+)
MEDTCTPTATEVVWLERARLLLQDMRYSHGASKIFEELEQMVENTATLRIEEMYTLSSADAKKNTNQKSPTCLVPRTMITHGIYMHMELTLVTLRGYVPEFMDELTATEEKDLHNLRVRWSSGENNPVASNDALLSDQLRVYVTCLLYTSDAADEEDSVDLGGRRIIKKKKKKQRRG